MEPAATLPRGFALAALALWLLFSTALTPYRAGGARLVLAVPASYLSVGQEFEPQLLDPTGAPALGTFRLELVGANGKIIWQRPWSPALPSETVALPHSGAYQLRAAPEDAPETSPGDDVAAVAVNAVPEPTSLYGGVRALAEVGLDEAVTGYLAAHDFAVSTLTDAQDDPVVVVGDARLGGDDVPAQYRKLWQAAAAGARVLLLEPPPPAVAPLWPLQLPLAAAPADCGADLFLPPLTDGLTSNSSLAALLHPPLAFDLGGEQTIDLYHWDGTRLLRPNPQSGYKGCYPLFNFRYGDGWVTVSTLPLLEHFQDTRARIFLMNLIKAMGARRRPAPASPGLQWVMEKRLARPPAADYGLEAAYTPPPAAITPPPVMAAAVTDGNPRTCFAAPEPARAGMTVSFNLAGPPATSGFTLNLGPQADGWPDAFALETSADGYHWQEVQPTPPIAAGGIITAPPPAAPWRAARLRLTDDGGGLRVCEITPAGNRVQP